MIGNLLEQVPTFWKIPVLASFVAVLLFCLLMLAGYRIKLPYFLGEIGPAPKSFESMEYIEKRIQQNIQREVTAALTHVMQHEELRREGLTYQAKSILGLQDSRYFAPGEKQQQEDRPRLSYQSSRVEEIIPTVDHQRHNSVSNLNKPVENKNPISVDPPVVVPGEGVRRRLDRTIRSQDTDRQRECGSPERSSLHNGHNLKRDTATPVKIRTHIHMDQNNKSPESSDVITCASLPENHTDGELTPENEGLSRKSKHEELDKPGVRMSSASDLQDYAKDVIDQSLKMFSENELSTESKMGLTFTELTPKSSQSEVASSVLGDPSISTQLKVVDLRNDCSVPGLKQLDSADRRLEAPCSPRTKAFIARVEEVLSPDID